MIPDLNIHEWRIFGSGFTALAAAVADGVAAPEGSWESIGIKTLLIAAIIYLARELATQRKSEAQAGAERERKAEERQREMAAVVQENSKSMAAMTQEVAKQTSYFESLAKTLLGRTKTDQ